MGSEVGILSLETLHVWITVDKKRSAKVVRFARISIDADGKKTHQINAGEGWKEVPEIDYYTKVEELRNQLIEKLKGELMKEGTKQKTPKT